ncbi:MAG: hypothetical protein GY929_19640 [Actinomycetia bacterium]|nr:hypothetical protein [Actinomycetes bacterium]
MTALLLALLAAQTVGIQIEPDVTVVRPPPPAITCTSGGYSATVGVNHHDTVTILVAAELTDGIDCTIHGPTVEAGGYTAGDPVWDGHTADLPTLYVCAVLFDGTRDERDCVRIAACESGSLTQGIDVVSSSNDISRWQHNLRYVPDRLAAVGYPGGDPTDLWVQGLMTRWLVDQSGGWGAWSCARKVGA